MNRRSFLQHSLTSPLIFNLLSCDSTKLKRDDLPHFFLLIRIFGGMDSILGLNPWLDALPNNNDLFLDKGYKVSRNVNGTEINLGPSAKTLAPYANSLSIINGIFMGSFDAGHAIAQNYITSANTNSNAPHFISILAEELRKKNKQKTGRIIFNSGLNTNNLIHINRYPTQLISNNKITTNYTPPKLITKNNLSDNYKPLLITKQSAEILRKYKTLLPEQAAVIALASGYSKLAQIDINETSSLDSHVNYANNHQAAQEKVWVRIAKLIKLMKEIPYLNTEIPLFPNLVTLAVTNEFSRLPALNGNNGKDHNYFNNSILLGGRNINGGSVIGGQNLFLSNKTRKRSQLSGCFIDYNTGSVIKNSTNNSLQQFKTNQNINLIRPENVIQTFSKIFNINLGKKSINLGGAQSLPLIIKN